MTLGERPKNSRIGVKGSLEYYYLPPYTAPTMGYLVILKIVRVRNKS